ncbi:GFA family protein [Novosphingobium sp. Gsoil 351]|nr:GFA family protein [Novosphingobium sp. Gsoil 351]
MARLPDRIVECGCSICAKLGVQWAYYAPSDVHLGGATDTYVCNNRVIAFHRCRTCGCLSHWATLGTDYGRMGVNARLFDGVDLSRIEVRVIAGPGSEAFE